MCIRDSMYTKGKPNKNVQKFIDYMLGSKVQNDLVPKLGYISINKMQVERDSNNHVVRKMCIRDRKNDDGNSKL